MAVLTEHFQHQLGATQQAMFIHSMGGILQQVVAHKLQHQLRYKQLLTTQFTLVGQQQQQLQLNVVTQQAT